MELQFNSTINEGLYLKNPQSTPVGKAIIRESILMMADLGNEHFTFKKLAIRINTTEATVYRYFENKHLLLLYVINLYWLLIEFQIIFYTQNLKDNKSKINRIIQILMESAEGKLKYEGIDVAALYRIIITEGNKVYMTKSVKEDNDKQFFKAYKDLCNTIAEIFKSYNAKYKYHHSLASTLIEMAHLQHFFAENLPRLTDKKGNLNNNKYVAQYLDNFVFSVLDKK
jgi:AcrR family transcriptional regulator